MGAWTCHALRSLILGLADAGLGSGGGADGAPLAFLRQEFGAQLAYHRFPGKIIALSPQTTNGLENPFSIARAFISVISGTPPSERIVRETAASMVISDNRYGLWNKEVFSVFITHQVFIRAPKNWKWAEPLHWRVSVFYPALYQCWVPDFESEPNLSGALSHNRKFSDLIYIGRSAGFQNWQKWA
jgi:hypothetical protein